MIMIAAQPARKFGWNSQPVRVPYYRSALAQQGPAPDIVPMPTSMPTPTPKAPFLDSALVQGVFSLAGAISTGLLAQAAWSKNRTWGYIWTSAATLLTVKTFSDFSQARER